MLISLSLPFSPPLITLSSSFFFFFFFPLECLHHRLFFAVDDSCLVFSCVCGACFARLSPPAFSAFHFSQPLTSSSLFLSKLRNTLTKYFLSYFYFITHTHTDTHIHFHLQARVSKLEKERASLLLLFALFRLSVDQRRRRQSISTLQLRHFNVPEDFSIIIIIT